MYKALTLFFLVIIGTTCGSEVFSPQLNLFQRFNSPIQNGVNKIDTCPACINEVVELINVVLNVILDEGIMGSCDDICHAVYNKTQSKDLEDLCFAGCDGLGIDEFIKLIIKADIDPIYYCQIVHLCPIKDDGDAKFINFGVYPQTGPEGTTFMIDMSFKTVNGTGTGTFNFNIVDPKNETTGDQYWFEEKKPGSYIERIAFQTVKTVDCDPSSELCGMPLGVYKITAQICNGVCGSQHPHTSIYDSAASSFNMTKKA